jgi:hypothetical protein
MKRSSPAKAEACHVSIQIAEEDYFVTRRSATGTHLCDSFGNGPTGRGVRNKAIHIHEVVFGNRLTCLVFPNSWESP